ncbi:hypothetical protein [Shewanella gelidii]|uniref:PBP domain-containing protein n=1 Tax=Shewanella gelidii TaxID=1642821 RepID=A0A917JR73_9GAMM|nr:hypothetical protein [Shewanella gelidii]MCL1097847.1 hypothetical protein [Shewanella gelidii]GGI78288.1 hypothetical protein GCM10009332_14590 [Shewanella gelidii]
MRFLTIGMLVLCLFCARTLAAQVIVHDSVLQFPTPLPELRLIFSKQKTFWPDGQPIAVFILAPDSDLHQEFCIKQLDILPYILQRRWDRLVYSGTGERPVILDSEEEMRERVNSTPGAIGYISESIALAGGNYVWEQ